MCAIAGGIKVGEASVARMLELLAHRGPDDHGIFRDADADVTLGHRRLAIIDLSPAGHQPMLSEDDTLALVFNGEIYNYQELRAELVKDGQTFRSTSDTEVILNGYRAWGAEVFRKIDGMWALALYDKTAGTLFLSRDPAGIKPIYIYERDGALFFASEIGALAEVIPSSARGIRDAGIDAFLAHGYLAGTETIYSGITALPAGSVRAYSVSGGGSTEESIYVPSERFAVRTMQDAVAQFNELFSASVRATLQSDVPVGLFLSGGIDSALTGYHVKAAGANLNAFTIGFAEHSFDESTVASRIAQHLGFPHTTYLMKGTDVANDIERILDSFGQPFADTSALPTYYLSKLAREAGITVALGGDGADELFGGYQTHYLPSFAETYRRTPRATDTLLRSAAACMPGGFTKLGNREKLTRFVQAARNPYAKAHAQWKRVFTETDLKHLSTSDGRVGSLSPDAAFEDAFAQVHASSQNEMDEVMKVDFLTFMQSSCLVKSDIASMQHGLEIRLPFLNKDIIDFAWYLPTRYKTGPFSTKRILRRALAEHVPADITGMKKQGFVPPLALWLTSELKPAMLSILSEEHIAQVGFLEYKYIASLIEDHLALRADNSKKLWALMSLVRFLTTHA